jgi:polyhydroxybutyrate depolymerase
MLAPHRRLAVALALTGALLLGACAGSSDEAAEGGDPTTTEADDATTTTTEAVDAAAPGEVATGEPVPSAGCGRTEVRSVVLEKTFLDDSDRWFLLNTPLEHDGSTPLPVVLDFHGLSEGADVHSQMSAMGPFADEEGFVVVMPHGTGTPVRWQVDLDPTEGSDLQYAIDLIDQLEAKLCIDTSRIYATGLSNGAFFSSVLGCSLSERIAAIAPVAGVIRPEGCDPARPVPVLAFHGTEDPILLFNGGVGGRLSEVLENGPGAETTEAELPEADLDGEGYPANIRAWAEANGCEGEPTDEQLTETVLRQAWDCPAEAAVEFYVLEGGGHSWPGSEFSKQITEIVGPTDDLDANEVLWAFFQRFRLPS